MTMRSEAPTRRAVIDVGTNSVKLLVADVTSTSIEPVLETSEQTRLGRGFYESHSLQTEAIQRTASAIARFVSLAREQGAREVRPFATSAARDARNGHALVCAIRDACGLELAVISGDTEAEWAFQGASTHPALQGHLFLLVDVGGGSTEFILGQQGHCRFSRSVQLGTVRSIEAIPHGDPPTAMELAQCRAAIGGVIQNEVRPSLEGPLSEARASAGGSGVVLAATGGTATILAAMDARMATFDRDRIESACLTRDAIQGWIRRLWTMPLAARRQLPGLPPARADVILAGVVIFEAILEQLGFPELRVSTRGLRFAALRELWRQGR
jgi:exopolyphosphatase/guanosine-5'-triphosphate,3'-diphosphate pyrophosphatase